MSVPADRASRSVRRSLVGVGLPNEGWLVANGPRWLTAPKTFPLRCSWCWAKFLVLDSGGRRCKKCDGG